MRILMSFRFLLGQPIRDLLCPAPACPGGGDVSEVDHVARTHVPLERGVEITAASRCSAINAAFSRRPAPRSPLPGAVQLRAIGFQLRLIGHGADQWVAKAYSARGANLTWSTSSASMSGVMSASSTRGQQLGVESSTDNRCGVQCLLGGRFKAVDAGTNGGVKGGWHLSLVTSPCTE